MCNGDKDVVRTTKVGFELLRYSAILKAMLDRFPVLDLLHLFNLVVFLFVLTIVYSLCLPVAIPLNGPMFAFRLHIRYRGASHIVQ